MSLRNLACVGWASFVLGSGCAVGAGDDPATGKKPGAGDVVDAAIADTATDGVGAPDAGGTDLGSVDTGTPPTDAGTPDTDPLDVGSTDVGTPDTATPDTATPDTGVTDTGVTDTGVTDTGTTDTGVPDTGTTDTGTTDTGTTDTGTICAGAVKLLINEVQLQDPKSSSFKSAEFVELYNPNDCAVDLSTFQLLYKRLAADPSPVVRWTGSAGKVIAAKGYWVIGSTTYVGARDDNFASPYDMSELQGGLALQRSGTTVDAVGWGTPSYVEGSPALAPPMGMVLARLKSGGVPKDTGSNSLDWTDTLTITPGAPNL